MIALRFRSKLLIRSSMVGNRGVARVIGARTVGRTSDVVALDTTLCVQGKWKTTCLQLRARKL
jgi:hypothetical protein